MAGAIPSRFGLVPAYETTHVRANSRHLFHAKHQDLSFLALNRAERFPLRGTKTILNEVVGIIFVFTQIVPGAATDFLPIWGKQIAPGIFDSGDPIAGHDGGTCSEGEAVSTKARRDKLILLI